MRASELIEALQLLVEQQGDCVVQAQNGDRDGSTWAEVGEVSLDENRDLDRVFNIDTLW